MRRGSTRLRSCAFALGLVAAVAHAEAPVCSNPPPTVATDGIMRHADVAAAVRDLAAEIERDRQRAGLASVAIAVVHGETVLLAAGYGCANVARGTPATPDTVYRTGSVTKLFEATALMQLRDAGRLQLDDPVAKSVPEVRFLGLNGERALPTWRQLASHTSGLPRDIPPVLGTVPGLFHYLERERAVNAPGARYAYSNLGFVVLGASIAEVAGERYHAYVRRHILEPLGMTASTFDPRGVPGDRLAAGYLRLDRTGDGWSGYAAGDRNPFPPLGTLLSSVNDLSRFIAFQFRRPVAGEAQVLSPASIREMWRPVAAIGPLGGAAAIGWLVLPYGPYTMVRKDGGLPGFTANVTLVPEARLGAVAFVNESSQRVPGERRGGRAARAAGVRAAAAADRTRRRARAVGSGDRSRGAHRLARREPFVPARERGTGSAPVVVAVAEVEPAERASSGDAADRRLAGERGGAPLEQIEPGVPLLALSLHPVGPLQRLRPEDRLVASEDPRVEDAVADRLQLERRPARLALRAERACVPRAGCRGTRRSPANRTAPSRRRARASAPS